MGLVAPITLRNADGETVPLNILSGTLDWKKLKKMLLNASEPTEEERQKVLNSGKSALYLMRDAFMETAKKLPHAPGGHPFTIEDEERVAVCKRIKMYRIDEHMDTSEAVAKVADELKRKGRTISEKTLRRYFDQYVKTTKRPSPR
jgi:hypothetical protein